MSKQTFLQTVELYGWTLHVVDTGVSLEYMIVDQEGRTVEFSENAYGHLAFALRDGLNSLCTYEAGRFFA